MDALERRNFLLGIITSAAKAHRTWVESGESRLLPEDELYQRFEEIAQTAKFVNRQNASDTERLFVAFQAPWRAFVASQQANMDVTMLPGENVWKAWEALEDHQRQAATPELKDVEPIDLLVKQGVGERQICLIYGFLKLDGSPDFRKLREEMKEPGKHTGPETGWVAPVNKHIVEQIEQRQIEYDAVRRRRQAKVAAAVTPAPETIEQLVADGVSATQIAKMKRIKTAEVLEYCRANGLPEPPLTYENELRGPKSFDFEKSDSRQRIEATMGHGEAGPSVGGPQGGADDNADDLAAAEGPQGSVDTDALPLVEANQMQEASTYFTSGMKPAEIAQAMGIHTNTVRSLLKKAGYDLNAAPAT